MLSPGRADACHFPLAAFIGTGLPTFEIRDVPKVPTCWSQTPALVAALARLSRQAGGADARHFAVVVANRCAQPLGLSVYLELTPFMQMQALLSGAWRPYHLPLCT